VAEKLAARNVETPTMSRMIVIRIVHEQKHTETGIQKKITDFTVSTIKQLGRKRHYLAM